MSFEGEIKKWQSIHTSVELNKQKSKSVAAFSALVKRIERDDPAIAALYTGAVNPAVQAVSAADAIKWVWLGLGRTTEPSSNPSTQAIATTTPTDETTQPTQDTRTPLDINLSLVPGEHPGNFTKAQGTIDTPEHGRQQGWVCSETIQPVSWSLGYGIVVDLPRGATPHFFIEKISLVTNHTHKEYAGENLPSILSALKITTDELHPEANGFGSYVRVGERGTTRAYNVFDAAQANSLVEGSVVQRIGIYVRAQVDMDGRIPKTAHSLIVLTNAQATSGAQSTQPAAELAGVEPGPLLGNDPADEVRARLGASTQRSDEQSETEPEQESQEAITLTAKPRFTKTFFFRENPVRAQLQHSLEGQNDFVWDITGQGLLDAKTVGQGIMGIEIVYADGTSQPWKDAEARKNAKALGIVLQRKKNRAENMYESILTIGKGRGSKEVFGAGAGNLLEKKPVALVRVIHMFYVKEEGERPGSDVYMLTQVLDPNYASMMSATGFVAGPSGGGPATGNAVVAQGQGPAPGMQRTIGQLGPGDPLDQGKPKVVLPSQVSPANPRGKAGIWIEPLPKQGEQMASIIKDVPALGERNLLTIDHNYLGKQYALDFKIHVSDRRWWYDRKRMKQTGKLGQYDDVEKLDEEFAGQNLKSWWFGAQTTWEILQVDVTYADKVIPYGPDFADAFDIALTKLKKPAFDRKVLTGKLNVGAPRAKGYDLFALIDEAYKERLPNQQAEQVTLWIKATIITSDRDTASDVCTLTFTRT